MRFGPLPRMMTFLRVGGRGLVFVFVGRVEVRREAFELGGAGIHALVDRPHAVLLAQLAHRLATPLPRRGAKRLAEALRRRSPCAWLRAACSAVSDSVG